jgi:hypothetical protein
MAGLALRPLDATGNLSVLAAIAGRFNKRFSKVAAIGWLYGLSHQPLRLRTGPSSGRVQRLARSSEITAEPSRAGRFENSHINSSVRT